MTSLHENTVYITGSLWGESTGEPHKWSLMRSSSVFFAVNLNKLLLKTVMLLVIGDIFTPMWCCSNAVFIITSELLIHEIGPNRGCSYKIPYVVVTIFADRNIFCIGYFLFVDFHLKIHTHNSHSKNAMMTSSNGNIFRVTGPLCGEFTGDRWIPLTMASDAELWYFLLFAVE